MNIRFFIASIFIALAFCTFPSNSAAVKRPSLHTIEKIEMNLDIFGVESDYYPAILAKINCVSKKSICKKSYYNPKIKGSTYSLNKKEIDNIIQLLENADLANMRKDYTIGTTDQPTSTTTIHTKLGKFVFNDYGLQAPSPLKDLYNIVYKLKSH